MFVWTPLLFFNVCMLRGYIFIVLNSKKYCRCIKTYFVNKYLRVTKICSCFKTSFIFLCLVFSNYNFACFFASFICKNKLSSLTRFYLNNLALINFLKMCLGSLICIIFDLCCNYNEFVSIIETVDAQII